MRGGRYALIHHAPHLLPVTFGRPSFIRMPVDEVTL